MSPALIGILVVQLIRLLTKGNGGPTGSGQGGPVGAWGVFVWFVLVPIGFILFAGVLAGQLYLLPPLLMIFALTFPWPITRRTFIPMGWPRLAFLLAYTSDFTFRLDRRGGAALAAAWAIARQRELDEESAEWLTGVIAKIEPLSGAGMVASGLLLAARGDIDGARAMIESIEQLDPRATPTAVRRLARGWLAAEAAARGDWVRVGELGSTLGEGGREAWLLSGVAQSLRLEPMAPGRVGLWMRWAIAPHHRETLPIVKRALAALDGAFIDPLGEEPVKPAVQTSDGDDFALALSLHASLLRRKAGEVTIEDLRALSQAWDVVLDDRATERLVAERALLIGASGGKPALARLRGAVEEDLADVVLAAGISLKELGDRGSMAERVRRNARDRLLSEVEAMSDGIRRRVEEKRELPAIDEWREWSALRMKYERGVKLAGQDFRRLGFYKVHPDGCSLAVWLFNERKQRPLGNAIFRWLLAEAEAVEDQRAIALQAKNVGCGI